MEIQTASVFDEKFEFENPKEEKHFTTPVAGAASTGISDLLVADPLECPHCGGGIEVLVAQLNCRIFRHGVFRDSGLPIHPHLSQSDCEQLVASERIYGCGKPFQIVTVLGKETTRKCDYI